MTRTPGRSPCQCAGCVRKPTVLTRALRPFVLQAGVGTTKSARPCDLCVATIVEAQTRDLGRFVDLDWFAGLPEELLYLVTETCGSAVTKALGANFPRKDKRKVTSVAKCFKNFGDVFGGFGVCQGMNIVIWSKL